MHGEAVERLKAEPYVRPVPSSRTETEALLPALSDTYKAAGTADNHEISRLVVIMGKDGFKPGGTAYHFLQYVHMGIGEFGFTANGEQFYRVVFSDLQPKLLTFYGRSLQRTCDYIALRRMPWIRLADRDFRNSDGAADGEPIITRMEVTDWVKPQQ